MISGPSLASTATMAQTQTLAQSAPTRADDERKRSMAYAWKAYKGELPDPLKVAADQPNDNVKSNRCAPIVDKGVSFLFGQVLQVQASSEIGDDETGESTGKKPTRSAPTTASKQLAKVTDPDKQDVLDDLWGDEDVMMTQLCLLAMNGGVCGQAFIKLVPRDNGRAPRVVLLDPLLVRAVTAPDDCTEVLAYLIEYPGPADWQKRQIITRIDPNEDLLTAGDDPQDTWSISNYVRRGGHGSWAQIGESDTWPYPFAPIFACQNQPNPNEWWGTPDLTDDLIRMNEVLNFIQSNTARILKYHAHPKTWASGVNASNINTSIDGVICLPSPDSKLGNLEMTHNLTDSLSFAGIIRSDMDEQSRVPGVALGRITDLPRGNISGVALQLLFQPLIEKTVQKQRLYGGLIRAVSRAALCMVGKLTIQEYDRYEIDLPWQNLLPADDLIAAQRAVLLLQIGASKKTLLIQLGYDPDAEAENIAESAQKALDRQAKAGLPLPPLPTDQQQMMPPQQGTTMGKPMPGGDQKPMASVPPGQQAQQGGQQ